jgi:hypothetical protein
VTYRVVALALWGAVVLAGMDLARAGSLIASWIAGRLERKYSWTSSDTLVQPPTERVSLWLPLPMALLAAFDAGIGRASLEVGLGDSDGEVLGTVFRALAIFMASGAVIERLKIDGSRRTRYEFALSAVCFYLAEILQEQTRRTWPLRLTNDDVDLIVQVAPRLAVQALIPALVLLLCPLLGGLVRLLGLRRGRIVHSYLAGWSQLVVLCGICWATGAFELGGLVTEMLNGGSSTAAIDSQESWWSVDLIGPAVCALSIPGLLLRYFTGAALAARPIVYLRSFSHQPAADLFGSSVARAASRYGTLVALVHRRQAIRALARRLRMTERSSFSVVPDDRWQPWVDEQLTRCSAVIVDASASTDGLNWELSRVRELVDPRNVVVLRDEQSQVSVDIPGGSTIEYSASRALGRWMALEHLRHVLRDMLTTARDHASRPRARARPELTG